MVRDARRCRAAHHEGCIRRAAVYPRHCEVSEAIHFTACGGVDCFVAFAPRNDGYRDVMPREGGASSTLRLIGSMIDVSGILDRPPEPVIGRPFGRPVGGR